jgi:hypothetical protein
MKLPLRLWGHEPLEAVPSAAEAVEFAARARAEAGQRGATTDLRLICAVARAQVQTARLGGAEGGQEAMLVPLPSNRFGVSVDPTPPGGWRRIPIHLRKELKRHRLRFRIGHELGHTLFYSRDGDEPQRHLFDSPSQEDFCDSFSRELLIPQQLARRAKPSPEGLLRLRKRCDVSLELAARAMSAVQPEVGIALWFDDPETGVILQWASDSFTSRSVLLSKGLPDDSSLNVKWLRPRRQALSVS